MQNRVSKIGFGGGCHWCTEAIFQSLKGVENVEQGWIASTGSNDYFSEAVVVYFNNKEINLDVLIEVHLLTHKSTSNHSMRKKYRSAIYYFSNKQKEETKTIINNIQLNFNEKIITAIYPYSKFKLSPENSRNYYLKNPKKPFCKRFIHPKLLLIENRFRDKYKYS